MLTPASRSSRRRFVLGALAAVSASACARITPRPSTPATVGYAAEFDAWTLEARTILTEAIETLQTFDVFQAFRVSTAPDSSTRLPSELAWDPPTSAAWDDATHVTIGLHGRAEQLLLAVTTAALDAKLWREQRRLADATHELVDLGDALSAYRNRLDGLSPGDASGALGLLDKAWAQWDAAAARWGTSRAEPIGCANVPA
jgi:hypothetical protein